MKVIGAGFGRTGTMSLKAALELLGYGPCYHAAGSSGGWWRAGRRTSPSTRAWPGRPSWTGSSTAASTIPRTS
ncbi:sulfotransferase [Nonomuraea sp. NPDC050680]|uniref:sulfotransferase n=1 Tax=Nonomuraea sp. NPDC050680 TaxID=3154630 RepID=UPI003400B85E